MKSFILFLCVATTCLGFAKNPADTTLYTSNGRQKAIVAVMPLIDHSGEKNIPWDLSRELTDEMRKRVYDSSKLYLLKEGGSLELSELFNSPDPTAIPADIKNRLGPCEFVVVMELLEEKETPFGSRDSKKNHEAGALLSLAIRMRVIDLRKEMPKIVLQEILHNDQNIAKSYLSGDYSKSLTGNETYERTAFGMAHSKILREAVARLEGYIEAVR